MYLTSVFLKGLAPLFVCACCGIDSRLCCFGTSSDGGASRHFAEIAGSVVDEVGTAVAAEGDVSEPGLVVSLHF